MKTILLMISLFLTLPFSGLADPPEDTEKWIDTLINIHNINLHVKRISREEFNIQHTTHYRAPSKPETNIQKVIRQLGHNYFIKYDVYGDEAYSVVSIKEFRKGKKFRMLLDECEEFIGYFPKEGIILYSGGHSSDHAFYIRNGMNAYNPKYSAFSAKKSYRITGLFSGQDDVIYYIEKYNPVNKQWIQLCILSEIMNQIPYEVNLGYTAFIFEPFWVDNTLYFRTGYEADDDIWITESKFAAITMPE